MSNTITRAAIVRPAWLVMAWKELRENAKWACLGLAGLALALCYAGNAALQQYLTGGAVRTYWQAVATTMALGAPLAALLLALLQTVPEQRRDLSAFVLHRPAPRAALYWGKVVTGLTLYALVTVLPLLGVSVWAQRPGHLNGPFVWGLTIPGFASILAGIPFYFAGLLTGLRPSRWYASRPIAAALLVALPLNVDIFIAVWPGVLLTTIAAVLFAVAARAAYITRGTFDGASPRDRASLAAVLYLASVLAVVLLGACLTFVQRLVPIAAPPRSVGDVSSWTAYHVLNDGELVTQTTQAVRSDPAAVSYAPVRDALGRPVSAIASKDRVGGSEPYLMLPTADRSARPQFFREPDSYLNTGMLNAGEFLGESWYWTPATGQLSVYRPRTHGVSGVFGPAGFAPLAHPERAGRFAAPLRRVTVLATGEIYFLSGGVAYLIAPRRNEVLRIALPFPSEEVEAVGMLAEPRLNRSNGTVDTTDREPDMPAVAMATRSKFAVVSHKGDVLFVVNREFDTAKYPSVSALGVNDTGDVQFWYIPPRSHHAIYQVSVWSAKGRHIATYPLPKLPYIDHPAPAVPADWSDGLVPAAAAVAQLGWLAANRPRLSEFGDVVDRLPNLNERASQEHILAIGILCAIAGFLIARRRLFKPLQSAVWALGMFWLGIPGLLMLLSMEDFPARVSCHQCKKMRVVTRDICEHCAVPFPGPAMDGAEIFGGPITPPLTLNDPASSMTREELTR